MSARSIDGSSLAAARRSALAPRLAALRTRGVQACLASVGLGGDAAWAVYRRRQQRDCDDVGITFRACDLEADAAPEDLDELIESLNADPEVHGIILQAPLPEPFDLLRAQALIGPTKDVEGVTPANLGLVMAGRSEGIAPCTARAAALLAAEACGDLRGVEAVVVGASTIVGKPLAQLLLHAGATVRVCHIDTRDLAAHTRQAELLVVAVGKAGLIGPELVRPGATVIDVGINRVPGPDGRSRIVGDVDPAVAERAGALSPVPGGVGALTTAILLEHCVQAAERQADGTAALPAELLMRTLAGSGLDLAPGLAERLAGLISGHLPAISRGPMRSAFARRLARGPILLDGGTSTALMAAGVEPTRLAEVNRDRPELVQGVHRAFREAGAEVLTANTFGISRLSHGREEASVLLRAAVRLARLESHGRLLVLGSIGPLGPTINTDIEADKAAEIYAEIALSLAEAGVDAVVAETMSSTREAVLAVQAVRRASALPVIACRGLIGLDDQELAEFALAASEAGAVAVGLNCSAGPRAMLPMLRRLCVCSPVPVLARPNAGHPRRQAGCPTYDLRPAWFARQVEAYLEAGVHLIGGCCGVAADHIAAAAPLLAARSIQRWRRPVQRAEAGAATRTAGAQQPSLPCARPGMAMPALVLLAATQTQAAAEDAARRLAASGAAGIGLDPGWPGSGPEGDLPARLRALQDAAGAPGLLCLHPAAIGLDEARGILISADLLGLRQVVIDTGILGGAAAPSQRGCEAIDLLRLVTALNQGRDLSGRRLDRRCSLAAMVRLGVDDLSAAADYAAAGAMAATLQPVYDPALFRRIMAKWDQHGLPLWAEVLVLPDADTAEELDNEVPAIHVPSRLIERLRNDPAGDVRGVLHFLAAWRQRLAGVVLLLPDDRSGPAEAVLGGLHN